MRAGRWPATLATVLLVALSARAGAQNATCLACHGMRNLGYRDSTARARHFAVDAAAFARSVHGALTCEQCHAGTAAYPHAATVPTARATCDGDCHATDPAGRPYTHAREAAELRRSVHAPGPERDDPGCLSCHGAGDPHAVTRIAKATPAVRMASCVGCHRDEKVMARHRVAPGAVSSYERSFHYKAIRFGDTTTAGCPDCHGAHRVLPASDARSTIAAANLTRTCGRSGCHPNASSAFASSGATHVDLRAGREPVLRFEESFFAMLTGGTMLLLAVGIVLDVQKKFRWLSVLGRIGVAASPHLRRLTLTILLYIGRLRAVLTTSRSAALRAVRLILYD